MCSILRFTPHPLLQQTPALARRRTVRCEIGNKCYAASHICTPTQDNGTKAKGRRFSSGQESAKDSAAVHSLQKSIIKLVCPWLTLSSHRANTSIASGSTRTSQHNRRTRYTQSHGPHLDIGSGLLGQSSDSISINICAHTFINNLQARASIFSGRSFRA